MAKNYPVGALWIIGNNRNEGGHYCLNVSDIQVIDASGTNQIGKRSKLTMSTLYNNNSQFDKEKAVDGNLDTFAHTDFGDYKPIIQVLFDPPVQATKIRIAGRKQFGVRMNGVRVWVYKSAQDDVLTKRKEKLLGNAESYQDIDLKSLFG